MAGDSGCGAAVGVLGGLRRSRLAGPCVTRDSSKEIISSRAGITPRINLRVEINMPTHSSSQRQQGGRSSGGSSRAGSNGRQKPHSGSGKKPGRSGSQQKHRPNPRSNSKQKGHPHRQDDRRSFGGQKRQRSNSPTASHHAKAPRQRSASFGEASPARFNVGTLVNLSALQRDPRPRSSSFSALTSATGGRAHGAAAAGGAGGGGLLHGGGRSGVGGETFTGMSGVSPHGVLTGVQGGSHSALLVSDPHRLSLVEGGLMQTGGGSVLVPTPGLQRADSDGDIDFNQPTAAFEVEGGGAASGRGGTIDQHRGQGKQSSRRQGDDRIAGHRTGRGRGDRGGRGHGSRGGGRRGGGRGDSSSSGRKNSNEPGDHISRMARTT
mgnify:CR=1 FL=1